MYTLKRFDDYPETLFADDEIDFVIRQKKKCIKRHAQIYLEAEREDMEDEHII